MRLLALAALALGAFVLDSCSRMAPDSGTAPAAMASGGQPSFLGLIADAPFRTTFHAHRHVWQKYEEAHGPQVLEYTEEVWSDGHGGFSVTPEQLILPQLSPQAEQVFLLLQKSREGFLYRLRDFRVHELQAFLSEYQVEDLGGHIVVAGQSCERLRVTPLDPSPTYWELDVLPSNGLVLGVREYLRDGTLVSSVETTEYDTTTALSGPHQDLPTTPFTPATAQQVLGFSPLPPSFLPQGFVCTATEKVTLSNENWARYSYTDGGETLFVLHRREPLLQTNNNDPAGANPIRIFRVGRWTVAQATFNRNRMVVMGRGTAEVLAQILVSMLP